MFCYGDPDRNEPGAGKDCCAGMITFGPAAKLKFRLDHFTGVRFALFVYSTEQTGGYEEF